MAAVGKLEKTKLMAARTLEIELLLGTRKWNLDLAIAVVGWVVGR